MEETFLSIARTAVSFILLLIISFLFGRQINSHRNHFNLAMAITIGSVVSNMGFNLNINFVPMAWSFFTIVIIYYLAANLAYRVPFLNKLFAGSSCVLIENGKIIEKNLAEVKYTFEDLNRQLMEKDVFSISAVEKAILGPNGVLTVQKKDPRNREPLSIQVPAYFIDKKSLPTEVIINGNFLLPDSPNGLGAWLEGYLYGIGIEQEDIRYSAISSDGYLFIFVNSDTPKTDGSLNRS